MDACKNKVRKARAMQLQPPVSLETYNIPYENPIPFRNLLKLT